MVGTNSPLVLPEGLKKIAEEQLGETPEILEASLKTLREKIAQLPEADRITDTTDENIVRFLRARKFKIDEALERTVQYARFYVKYGQVLEGMKAEEFMMFSEFMTVLKDRDREGRVMLVLQPKKGIGIFTKEFVKQHPRAMLRCNVWMFERLSHDVNVQVCGLRLFNTFRNLTMSDQMAMQSMAPMSDQMATFKFFQLLGLRFGGAHIFEQPMIFNVIFMMARPFLSQKNKDKFQLCGRDYSKVRDVVSDLTGIPECLGGTLQDLDYNWIEQQRLLEGRRT